VDFFRRRRPPLEEGGKGRKGTFLFPGPGQKGKRRPLSCLTTPVPEEGREKENRISSSIWSKQPRRGEKREEAERIFSSVAGRDEEDLSSPQGDTSNTAFGMDRRKRNEIPSRVEKERKRSVTFRDRTKRGDDLLCYLQKGGSG